jgi:SAM-dependent methyltransferase
VAELAGDAAGAAVLTRTSRRAIRPRPPASIAGPASGGVASVRPVTDPPALGAGARLDFHGPLSAARADRLAADLARARPSTVTDLGCGWGELLLRIVAACPGARGVGVDKHGPDVARARANAATRRLDDRVTFVHGLAADHAEAADVVLNVGAHHAFDGLAEALQTLHGLVEPGGRLLFGAEFWEVPPTPERLAHLWPGTTADDCTDLAGLVDAAVAAGFRPLRIETATRDEWEEFESGYAAEPEEWLAANPGHPAADDVRAQLDAHRDIWLRGHRDVMGFAYLTLARSG